VELLLILLGGAALLYFATKSNAPAPAPAPAPVTRALEEPAGTRACGVAMYISPKTSDTSLAAFYASPPLLGAASKSPEVVAMTLSQKVDNTIDKKTVTDRAAVVREYAVAAECAGWTSAASDLYVFSDWLLSIEFDTSGKVTFIPPAPKSYTGPPVEPTEPAKDVSEPTEPTSDSTSGTESGGTGSGGTESSGMVTYSPVSTSASSWTGTGSSGSSGTVDYSPASKSPSSWTPGS
jgi:hypothetical protein